MAWIDPYTQWAETDRCTYTDANRIAGNVNTIAGTSFKEDYTQDDVIAFEDWEDIVEALMDLAEDLDYIVEDEPDTSVTALNLNTVEGLTLALHDWIVLVENNAAAVTYCGDGSYLGDGLYLRRTE